MTIVKRWFLETPEGDVIDGPFKKPEEAQKALDRHVKWYKYTPLLKEREMDSDTFTQAGERNERFY